MCDGTEVDLLTAPVADIRCFIKPAASFPLEIRAGLVAGGTGSTLDTARNDLSTSIRFLAVIAMNAEVLRIVESAFMIPVGEAVGFDLLRNGSWIFA